MHLFGFYTTSQDRISQVWAIGYHKVIFLLLLLPFKTWIQHFILYTNDCSSPWRISNILWNKLSLRTAEWSLSAFSEYLQMIPDKSLLLDSLKLNLTLNLNL